MNQIDTTAAEYIAEIESLRASLETAVGANALWKRLHDEKCAELAALREAAGKVTCWRCDGKGNLWSGPLTDATGAAVPRRCPDCADIRAILEKQP